MLTKKLSILLGSFGLSCLTTVSFCQAKMQTITVKNMTDQDLVIQIIRPDQRPCQSIQYSISKRETRDFVISSACSLVQFKVLGSAHNSEKTIDQLTYGSYTRFLIELNQLGDDIIVTPFTAEEQSWHRKVEQARERLKEKTKEEQKSYIKQI